MATSRLIRMAIKRTLPPVAYVEWADSACNRGWLDFNRATDGPSLIQSVGILVHSSKDFVTLTTSCDSAGKVTDSLSIPRSAIRKIRRVKIGN